LILVFLLFVDVYFVNASKADKSLVNDTVELKISEIRNILYSKEWVPADSASYNRLVELIDYIENSPIDSVVCGLKKDLDNSRPFIKQKRNSRIRKSGIIQGYISEQEKNEKLMQIESDVKEKFPLTSIIVPEEKFAGMYSRLPLIQADNVESMLEDSVITFPDSLMLLFSNPELEKNDELRNQVEEMGLAYLEKARKEYNQALIQNYRDSVSNAYRENYIQRLVVDEQEQYLDQISKRNSEALTGYNDSLSKQVDQQLRQNIGSLISYVDQMPNTLTIYNLFSEQYVFPMQNSKENFKWIWLKNSANDSIGIRIESVGRKSVKMLIDESVSLARLTTKKTLEVDRITPLARIDLKLRKVETRTPKISPWKLQGKAYSGFTQTYINDYWSQGGKSSASTLTTLYYEAKYSKDKFKWESYGDAKLGFIYYVPDVNETPLRNLYKNTDAFELNSRLGYSAFKKWYYSAEANFKTQFFIGYKSNYEVKPSSALFSPAYLTFSAGLDYKPGKDFSAFLSPLSLKTTYVTNPKVDETVYGLNEGETRHTRYGISGKFDFSKSIMENVSVKTKNSIFLNYGSDNEGNWQFLKTPDFDSETSVDFKVNQFITTQINFHLVYDKDVEATWTKTVSGVDVEQKGARLQVKEFFTLGISYKF
jgi:hypothetical protein